MRFKNLIIVTAFSILVYACSGATDALKGKKRSEQSDEFLVEKKSPLELPPDFGELPKPTDQENQESNEENNESEVKNILEIESNEESSQETNDQQNKSLENLILEKIN
tara:strand:+ start:24 stop:350 length:327 start_codon:yes stop_codon:yes gene_type:complete